MLTTCVKNEPLEKKTHPLLYRISKFQIKFPHMQHGNST